MKPFKTIEEQIATLKIRGLSITDESKAAKYLLSNNYYNIINGYSKFFQHPGTDTYIDGVTFDEVSSLYTFDKDENEPFCKLFLKLNTISSQSLLTDSPKLTPVKNTLI
ncbi:Abortive infection bacteriophage resistance protein [Streptococcus pneumoniae]|nr:Abortive infection bacteriophage resistance protein [Streptococcus pneumoniae]